MRWILAPTLLAAALGIADAAAQGTLAERRLAITKGTAPGKVLLELKRSEPAADAASAAASAALPTAAAPAPGKPATAPAAGAGAPRRSGGLFSALPPPSGRPLQAARKLDAPDQGIALPTARPASAASSAGR